MTRPRESLKVRLARSSGVPALLRAVRARRPVIVAYHGVCPDDRRRGWETADLVAESVFREHLAFYRRCYHVVPLRRIVEALSGRRRDLERRALAITFDDGYANNVSLVLPALQEFGFSATFFCTTSFLDGTAPLWWVPVKRCIIAAHRNGSSISLPGTGEVRVASADQALALYASALAVLKKMPADERDAAVRAIESACPPSDDDGLAELYVPMAWDDARTLVERGMEVGAHTVSHVILSRESPERARHEIAESVDRIRNEVNQDVVPFAYPNGQADDFTRDVERMVRDAGCDAAMAGYAGWNRNASDLYRLKRFPIGGHHTAGAVELDLCGLRLVVQHVRSLFGQD